METEAKRPSITDFKTPAEYIAQMIQFRKKTEIAFSVTMETKKLRKVSPSLVSLILNNKRNLTLDRIDEFSKLLNLNSSEKFYLKNWIESKETKKEQAHEAPQNKRKETSVHILSDWLNIYVKDYFEFAEIQKNPELIYEKLANIAPPQRIKKSMLFLIKHGYLRKKLDGSIVLDTPLTVTDPKISSQKIRNFHKSALKLARTNIDIYPSTERFANTATIALTESKYKELVQLIEDFSEKFKEFSETSSENSLNENIKIYQLIINLSPTGGETK